jgi:glutamate formiminotransferase
MTEDENVLVECVPNFSEGRREDVIAALVASVEAVTGVRALDRHSDADHNRTVITFVGAPQAVVEAAYQAMRTAAQHIDMDEHHGQHPRLGATDVVPFVPIAGVTLEECVGLARQLGERVGRDLGIPVYLYEAAATQSGRVNLADVRRGEYEALKQTIGTDSDRKPDFGPLQVGKAGATAIGARMPLVAYNIYLTTDDVTIAQHIARSVRHSGGGLAHVKALGLLVGGRAQVSMNLTDTTQTPIHRVVELVRLEAARFGTAIHSTELVGLIPQAALIDAARWYLQLDGFNPDQILEDRLRSTGD